MKKILIIIGSLVLVLLLAAILLPVIFKGDIQKAVDKEIDKYVDAEVYYDPSAFSLSLFTHFPDITVSIEDFGVTGRAPFEGDTLLSVRQFELTVDLMSAISGDQIEVKDVLLDRPQIRLVVLEDGTANYDIMKDTGGSEGAEDTSTADPISIAIEHWEIQKGDIVYLDQSMPFYTSLFGIDHSGTGDFSMEVFDMASQTSIRQLSVSYDGDEYITNKTLTADITMGMDLSKMKFTFKENNVSLNQFGFGFEGYLSMPEDDIEMDIAFSGKDIDMKSIVSLIPGLYQDYLDGISASGDVAFDGYVRGTYNDNSMPAIAANLNLMEGTLKYTEYPIPMEAINMQSSFDYPSSDLTETSFAIEDFSMMVDGQKFTASLLFRNLEDYFWDLKVDGGLDLEKVMRIIPIEDTDVKGNIQAAFATSGQMSKLEAEQYEQIEASGTIQINNLSYKSDLLPQGFGIADARSSFDPEQITLESFQGNAGRTDLNMSGKITNYLQYALEDDAILSGSFQFSSSLVDINEWMETGDESEEASEEDTASLEVVRIPTDIAFTLDSDIEKLVYDNLELKDFKGQVVIKGGAVYLNGVRFDLLDGSFRMEGNYATATEKPSFDFDFKIEQLSIPQAFQSFSTVQQLVPFAEKMNGKFSTDFKLGGKLGMDMMPEYETLTGQGLLEIAQASMEQVKLVSAVSSVSSLDAADGGVDLRDVILSAQVRDGRVYVEPFTVELAGYKAEIAGSNGVLGDLDYNMTVKNVSTGAVGDAVSSMVSSFTGSKSINVDKVDLRFGIAGNFNDPKVKLKGASPAGSESTSMTAEIKDQAKERLKEEKEKVVAEVEEQKEQAVDSAKTVLDSKKKEAEEKAKEEAEEAKEKAKKAVKNIFGNKKKGGG